MYLIFKQVKQEVARVMRVKVKMLLLALLSVSCISEIKKGQLPDYRQVQSISGDICIRNVSVIDPAGERVLHGMDIFIRSGIIESVNPTGDEISRDFTTIPGKGFYAMPGFVNTHTHLWQHLSRSVSPSEQLQQWIPKVYKPSYHLTDEEFYELNLAACYDALLHGITSVNDWTVNADESKFEQVLRAMIESGVGGVITWPHTAVFLPHDVQRLEFSRIRAIALENNRELNVAHLPPERIPIPFLYDGILLARNEGVPIAEHVMENVNCQRDWHSTVTRYLAEYGDRLRPDDKKFLMEIAATPFPPSIDIIAAMAQNARIVLGLIDGLPENKKNLYNKADIQYLKQVAKNTGPTYIPFLEHLGAFDNGYLSIHSSLVGPRDIEIFKKNGVKISHNPESNAYLSSGIAPISSYLQAGLTVTIGTDGAASNDRIDMLAAMRLMSHIQKLVSLNVPLSENMNSWAILRSATIDGAKALDMEHRTGSIEKGKEADIVLFNAASFGLNPVSEYENCIADLLVNSAESRDIFGVIADGQIKVWENRLVGTDESILAGRITEIRARAIARGDRDNEGREWSEYLSVGKNSRPVIRYRSIYPNYPIDFNIKNDGDKPARVSIVISDSEKAAGLFLAEETKERFPYKDHAGIEKTHVLDIELPAGSNFRLAKKSGGKQMRFLASTDEGISETMDIVLGEDPEWEWTMRANVYIGAFLE
jgi:cytosine/adenosine deaminase-related metal-dependent hydrolase